MTRKLMKIVNKCIRGMLSSRKVAANFANLHSESDLEHTYSNFKYQIVAVFLFALRCVK